VSGERKALIVANDEYEQAALRNLLAPAADAEALGRVLGDPRIGEFTVQVVHNQPSYVIQAQIEDLFSGSRPEDVLLMHFSGHGLKSDSGELFFAASNTRPDRLRATAVSADFVQQCMRDSRSRSIVLLLDCCYAGAFAQGVKVRATGDVHVLDSFPQEKSGGRGRAVITASNAMEYAFEGDQLADDQHRGPSVFTSALVTGLATGDADKDEDGWVGLDELYDYVLDKVHEQNPHQTPSRQVDLAGDLYLARSRRLRIRPSALPADLKAALASQDMYARAGAIGELRSRLASDDLPVAMSAYEALAELARNDIRFVAEPASAAISEAALRPAQQELHFGRTEQGSAPPHQIVPLLGPPIARACAPRPSDAWIRVDQVAEGLDVSIDTAGTGSLHASLALKGPTGEAVILIDVDLVPAPPPAPVPDDLSAPAGHGESATADAAEPDGTPSGSSSEPTPPADDAPPGPQLEHEEPGRQPGTAAPPTEEHAMPDARETVEQPAGVTPATVQWTSSGAARLLAAGFGLLLTTFCLAAVVLLRDDFPLGLEWAVVAINVAGIAVTVGGVRKNAPLAAVLLWNLVLGAVYWLTVINFQHGVHSLTTVSVVLATECAIAAAGNAGLCVWILVLRAADRGADLFLATFAGLAAIAYLLAAIAWVQFPSGNRPTWDATAWVLIVSVLVGLVALIRVLRPGTTGGGKELPAPGPRSGAMG
jgi:Caspase domain